MIDADDPIPTRTPEDTIRLSDAFNVVYRALNPDWQNLEEQYHNAIHERDDKDRANRERPYVKAQRRANEWLRERLSKGVLVGLISDPDTGQVFQLKGDGWASMGAFETGIADDFVGPGDPLQSGPKATIKGKRRPVFFDRKYFDKVLTEIATPPLKGGRPPEHDWAAIKAFALEQIAALGKPGRNNTRLPSKAQLIEIIQKEWSNRYDQHLPSSSVRSHLNRWLAEIDGN